MYSAWEEGPRSADLRLIQLVRASDARFEAYQKAQLAEKDAQIDVLRATVACRDAMIDCLLHDMDETQAILDTACTDNAPELSDSEKSEV